MPKQWSKCAWVTTTTSGSAVTARTASASSAPCRASPRVSTTSARSVAEHQARGEVQLRVPAGQHAVADLDPPSVGRARHLAEPDREGVPAVSAADDVGLRPASASPARSALAASRVASRAVALIAVRPA